MIEQRLSEICLNLYHYTCGDQIALDICTRHFAGVYAHTMWKQDFGKKSKRVVYNNFVRVLLESIYEFRSIVVHSVSRCGHGMQIC